MEVLKYLVFIVLICVSINAKIARKKSDNLCTSDALVVYRVKFITNWTKNLFPKHYPYSRPPAQWSKTYGRTHDSTYSLFQLESHASAGVKLFVETGRSEGVEKEVKDNETIFDEFLLSPIQTGKGVSETKFFVDSNHTMVSMIARIVPSPDWFVGVDSVKLCVDGKWIENKSIDLQPIDGGTDNGFTFTAPNWPTEPQHKIHHITSRYPSHHSGSFFYPQMKHLPVIAKLYLVKVKEYIGHEKTTSKHLKRHRSATRNQFEQLSDKFDASTVKPVFLNSSNHIDDDKSIESYAHDETDEMKDCQVSPWSSWSPCSKSCGLGEMYRVREILHAAQHGGLVCPSLKEIKWCGSARKCTTTDDYFRW